MDDILICYIWLDICPRQLHSRQHFSEPSELLSSSKGNYLKDFILFASFIQKHKSKNKNSVVYRWLCAWLFPGNHQRLQKVGAPKQVIFLVFWLNAVFILNPNHTLDWFLITHSMNTLHSAPAVGPDRCAADIQLHAQENRKWKCTDTKLKHIFWR